VSELWQRVRSKYTYTEVTKMYHEDTYKVESVTETTDGRVFTARQHVRCGTGKYRKINDIEIPDSVDLEPSDVIRVRVENHSDESGSSPRSWKLDRFIGFPYNQDRGWDYFDGL